MKSLLGKKVTGVSKSDEHVVIGFSDGTRLTIRMVANWNTESVWLEHEVTKPFDFVLVEVADVDATA